METRIALFRQNRETVTVQLLSGTVIRVQAHKGGILAWMETPEGVKYKFWAEKKDQPLGSRRRVFTRNGDKIPTISYEKAGFSYEIGAEVFFVKPAGDAAAFPVVSAGEYGNALRKGRRNAGHIIDQSTSGGHRWVS